MEAVQIEEGQEEGEENRRIRIMSEFEKQAIADRAKAMTKEEQCITAMNFPDDVLRNELERRYEVQNAIIKEFMGIANKINKGGDLHGC